jgi:hypothetical protein
MQPAQNPTQHRKYSTTLFVVMATDVQAAPCWLALALSEQFPSHATQQMHFSGHTYRPSSAKFSSKWDHMPALRSIGSI